MFVAYILFSRKLNKYYVGHTENIDKRFILHNSGKVRSTKNGLPWVIKYKEEFENRKDAYRKELLIKKYKSGRAFKKLIKK